MSSASLAREISDLVTRSLRGEAIDVAAHGKALAARYPYLGMSADLIAKAITRSVGMMETVRNGGANGGPTPPDAAAAPAGSSVPLPSADASSSERPANGQSAHQPVASAKPAETAAAQSTSPIPSASDVTAQSATPVGLGASAASRLAEGPLSVFRRALART